MRLLALTYHEDAVKPDIRLTKDQIIADLQRRVDELEYLLSEDVDDTTGSDLDDDTDDTDADVYADSDESLYDDDFLAIDDSDDLHTQSCG